jgi:hypothetical protein
MATIEVKAEREVAGGCEEVYRVLSDYREGRPRILPQQFRQYRVEEGGQGPGTVVSYCLQAGRRERPYRLRVEGADGAASGGSLTERDTGSSFVTHWVLEPAGDRTKVTLSSQWQGAGGVGGFFERAFAPSALRGIYSDVLERLARVVEGA